MLELLCLIRDAKCKADTRTAYGRLPSPAKAVSSYSASYPLPLCRRMASGSAVAIRQAGAHRWEFQQLVIKYAFRQNPFGLGMRTLSGLKIFVKHLCEALQYSELFRYRFKKTGHINCLESRVHKSWLKQCSKAHVNSRILGILDIRVTMGAAA